MSKNLKILVGVIAGIIIMVMLVTGGILLVLKLKKTNQGAKEDGWLYTGNVGMDYTSGNGLGGVVSNLIPSVQYGTSINSSKMTQEAITADSGVSTSSGNIGFSVGGSKNIENFRKNIENGYFPISTDITYNGLFYDYYFDTGVSKKSNELFSPAYSKAVSKDPISGKSEFYMTVGLNSNIKESDFKRKKQNIVVVLDISGSMDSSLDSYYYDKNLLDYVNPDTYKSKMKLANESVNLMLDKLKDDDRFGMVLFDDRAYLGKKLSLVGETDIKALKNHISEIEANGGTNFEAGYTKATELFDKELLSDSEYDNRIIIITDAMPNTGNTSKYGLLNYIEENANKNIYTTFLGVGVDFNTNLIEHISNVKGANYYSISSSSQFKKILSEDFEYMVTPLVFDLNLDFKSNGYDIEQVYGTDSGKKSTGNIMKVNTLFPAKTEEDKGTKGGVILLKLKKKEQSNSDEIKLEVSYTDREGRKHSNSQEVRFDKNEEFYENTGIRKSIMLTRYVNTLKNWILYERSKEDKRFYIDREVGITDCIYTKDEIYRILGEHERTSVALKVSDEYKQIFRDLKAYMENEKKQVKDNDLKQEIELLDKLINS